MWTVCASFSMLDVLNQILSTGHGKEQDPGKSPPGGQICCGPGQVDRYRTGVCTSSQHRRHSQCLPDSRDLLEFLPA